VPHVRAGDGDPLMNFQALKGPKTSIAGRTTVHDVFERWVAGCGGVQPPVLAAVERRGVMANCRLRR
jgi:hypothetical protein